MQKMQSNDYWKVMKIMKIMQKLLRTWMQQLSSPRHFKNYCHFRINNVLKMCQNMIIFKRFENWNFPLELSLGKNCTVYFTLGLPEGASWKGGQIA